jgi:small subunit ribosomal protein S15
VSIIKEEKQEMISKFQRNQKDTGSPEVQVAILTTRILNLTEHMKMHKKDFHTRKGLVGMVNERKKLLKYLKSENFSAYQSTIKALGLRK